MAVQKTAELDSQGQAVQETAAGSVPAGKKGKAAKVKKAKKERTRGGGKKRGKMVAIIIVVGLIAAAGACYYMNWFGVKDKVVGFFIAQDDQYQVAMNDFETQKAAYEQKEEEVAQLEQSLISKEQQLNQREAALDAAAEVASSSDTTSAAQVSGTAGDVTEEKPPLAVVYEKMNAEDAAGILNTVADNGWIANLFMQMDEKKVANIMALLDTDKAAIISRLMSDMS